MPSRLLNIGIAGVGLSAVAASYQEITSLPGAHVGWFWLLGIGGAALLAGWISRCTDGRRRELERENAEATAVLEIAQMANSAVNLEATMDLVVLTLQRTLGGPACAVFLTNREGTHLEMKAGSGVAAVASLELHLDEGGWS